MSSNNPAADPMANASREEITAALFANLVIQQTNMAFMFLGRVPHPETGEVVQDFESAKFFIDQLEMIEQKTKGNLDKREEGLLKQSLTGLRMAFVEAMDGKGAAVPTGKIAPTEPTAASDPAAIQPAPETPVAAYAPPEDESRKKFSKKY
ncbi:MAG: DUF1844 domain-containing protein [Verrucomicrobiota bacterium]